jgi:hypothetical protein
MDALKTVHYRVVIAWVAVTTDKTEDIDWFGLVAYEEGLSYAEEMGNFDGYAVASEALS